MLGRKIIVVVVLGPALRLKHLKCGMVFHFRCTGFLHNREEREAPQPGWRSGFTVLPVTHLPENIKFPRFLSPNYRLGDMEELLPPPV